MTLSFTTPELMLIALWFSVALWNTSVGPTGGITFATMASVLPPSVVIPVQALVEASSSVFRLWLLRLFVDWRFLLSFVVGGAVGFALGLAVRVVTQPSEDALRIVMGIFILLTTWIPLAHFIANPQGFPWLIGSVTSLTSLFTGGVATLIAAALDKKHDDHRKVIATMTASLIYQHAIKVVIFGMLGFSFATYAPLMAAMFAAAVAGTWIGKRLLINVPQWVVKPIFKALVTVLGAKLIVDGAAGFV